MISACSSAASTTRGDCSNRKIKNVKSEIRSKQQPNAFALISAEPTNARMFTQVPDKPM